MAGTSAHTILCLASHEKGQEFLREAKRQGWQVILLTTTELEHADWPRDSLDDIFFMPDLYDLEAVTNGVSYLARERDIRKIAALDDFDVQTAAALREHLQLPGIGTSGARLFRDKLAMRVRARERGIRVPEFVRIVNYDEVRQFTERVPPPWVFKPRSEAAAAGIRKMDWADELWARIHELGDRQSHHLVEQYLPGDVYHVDSIVYDGKVVFAEAHHYGAPLFDVAHGGGIFTTRTVKHGSADEKSLLSMNRQLLKAFGMERGASHTEFIKGRDDGKFYFLETSARVGGANIMDLIEAATGVNLWREWARIETLPEGETYQAPDRANRYAGIVITLAQQEYPDTSAYQDPEIVWRLNMRHHAGLIVASDDRERVQQLLDDYSRRFRDDFHAALPAPESLIR